MRYELYVMRLIYLYIFIIYSFYLLQFARFIICVIYGERISHFLPALKYIMLLELIYISSCIESTQSNLYNLKKYSFIKFYFIFNINKNIFLNFKY